MPPTLLLAAALSVVVAAACSALPAAMLTPTATPTPAPTAAVTATATLNEPAIVAALRARAEAFALARTEARFEDTYAFTLPSFREACGYEAWTGGLIVEAGVLRAFNGFGDDEPLAWTVRLVEVTGGEGTVVESVSTQTGFGLGIESRSWTLEDREWWLDEPPEEMCNL